MNQTEVKIAALNSGPGWTEHFKSSVDRLVELGNLHNIKIKGYSDKNWPLFQNLPIATQERQAVAMRKLVDLYWAAERAGVDLTEDQALLQFSLQHLSLSGDQDIVGLVEPDDLVEIMDFDFLQVYRNFNYFGLCNYSLVELTCVPWYELYERSSKVEEELFRHCEKLFKGEVAIVKVDDLMQPYTLIEKQLSPQSIFRIQDKYLIRLTDRNGHPYLVSTKKVEHLGVQEVKSSVAYI
jgi:hypothetical protein